MVVLSSLPHPSINHDPSPPAVPIPVRFQGPIQLHGRIKSSKCPFSSPSSLQEKDKKANKAVEPG